MTKNEAIRLLAREALLMFEHDGSSTLDGDTTLHIINQIFDDHEAQLKAKENDLERQDMIIKCLSMDLDSKEKQLKAKDKEIERLKADSKQAYIEGSKSCDDLLSFYITKIASLEKKLKVSNDSAIK